LLTSGPGEPAFRGQRSDSAKYAFIGCLQLDEQELAMHRDIVKVGAIWKDKVSVKFQPPVAETAEYPDYLSLGK
jgi:hypothetical protein